LASYKGDGDLLEIKVLDNVKHKMKCGKRLSYYERVFLKIHARDLYEKAMKIEVERDAYRLALANCNSTQEIGKVKNSKSVELQSEMKGNGDSEFVNMRMMAMMDEFSGFASGGG